MIALIQYDRIRSESGGIAVYIAVFIHNSFKVLATSKVRDGIGSSMA